ncbi:MAG: hypothetical protein ACI8W8_003458 [Rhodothermales bacterium]|jgi:hypothetical protein
MIRLKYLLPLLLLTNPLIAKVNAAITPKLNEWVDIFDGESLAGWERHGGKARYAVVDGAIVGTSQPNTPNTFLCTDREYSDFALEYDYFPHPTLNCGVQFRSKIREKDDRVYGYQCEIDPSNRKWSAGVYGEASRGWLYPVETPKAQSAFKPGEWNKVRIVCVGPSIRTYLNGIAVADLVDQGEKEGIIGLQVHGVGGNKTPMQIKWRNLRIMELAATDTVAVLDADTDTMALPAPRGASSLLAPGSGLDAWKLRPKKVPWMAEYVPGKLQWSVDAETGVAAPKTEAGSMDSKQTFGAQRIHVEFRTPIDADQTRPEVSGNSGVYIQGSYELQICNSAGLPAANNYCGGIYGQRAPDVNAAKPAGEWQAYDIYFLPAQYDADKKKLANARLSAKLNGQWIHRNVELTGSTGSGDAETPLPRPLRLQEHQRVVQFRNVWVCDLDNPVELKKYDPRKK